jgi:predicted CopG family antitoxin
MKKRLNVTIDDDVYEMIKELPRKVSVSEIISWFLKSMLEDIKRGGKFSQEEFEKWVESTPEGKDFRRRGREQFGPTIRKVEDKLNGIKEKIVPQKRKKAIKV